MTVVHRSGPSSVASDVRSYVQCGSEKDLGLRKNRILLSSNQKASFTAGPASYHNDEHFAQFCFSILIVSVRCKRVAIKSSVDVGVV